MDPLYGFINNKYLKEIKIFLIEQAAYAVNTTLHHDVTYKVLALHPSCPLDYSPFGKPQMPD